MPEVLTKHPDVVKEVLESAGAKCWKGLPQKILTKCPREAFCSLPGGEMCIYGATELAQMTQLTKKEVCETKSTHAQLGAESGGIALAFGIAAALTYRLMTVRRIRREP